MKARQLELRAIPQFDSGRWKLRLERVPISAGKQFNGPLVSSMAVGLTMLSPLVFLVTAYLWRALLAKNNLTSHGSPELRSRPCRKKFHIPKTFGSRVRIEQYRVAMPPRQACEVC